MLEGLDGKLVKVAILILAAVLLTVDIGKPFIGQHDWNSASYSQQARNYLRYGYLPLRFAAVDNGGLVTDPSDFHYSNHYPPLLPILISFSFRIFGVHEWSARLVPIIFSLGLILMIIQLGEMLVNKQVGWWAGLLASVTPLFIYYGKMPVHESLIPLAAMLTFYFYFKWRKRKNRLLFWGLVGSIVFAELIGWPGYYPAGIIVVYHLIRSSLAERNQAIREALWILGISIVMFLLFLWYSLPFEEEQLVDLLGIFLLRAGIGSQAQTWTFTWSQYLIREVRYSVNLMTATLLLLSGGWVLRYLYRLLNKITSQEENWLVLLGLFGLTHLLLFRNLAWLHEYMIIYSLPFVSLSAAWLFWIIWKRISLGNFNNWVLTRWLIFVVFLIWVGWERIEYAKALLDSRYETELYQEALRINRETKIDDKVTPRVDIDDGVALFNFYADRQIK